MSFPIKLYIVFLYYLFFYLSQELFLFIFLISSSPKKCKNQWMSKPCIKSKLDFIKYVQTTLKESDFKLIITSGSQIVHKKVGTTTGIFDLEEKSIRIAGGNPQCFPCLVHEFGHFLQYSENRKIWNEYCSISDKVEFWNWLNKKEEYPIASVKKCLDLTLEMELDCERTAVKLISKYNLPLNKAIYIQRANAYLFLYSLAFENRKWIEEPEGLYKKMPKTFRKNYSVIPDRIRPYLETL